MSYVWKIINRLHIKYNIMFDTRIYSYKQLSDIRVMSKHLLRIFLDDQFGENPFKDIEIPVEELERQCLESIAAQEGVILSLMPRVAGDPSHLGAIGQCVYDAMRAYLILVGHPIASKEEACSYFLSEYPAFLEVGAIYDGYLNPNSIVDVTRYVFDSLAVVKHLLYKAQQKPFLNEILLINTPSSSIPHPRDDYLSYDHNMPLGLVCLASYLGGEGQSVRILDSYAENLGTLATVDRIFSGDRVPKIVGLNSSSPNIHIVHEIARYLKRCRHDICVICGGPHASLATEHTLSTGDVDYAVAGEGEVPLTRLVKAIFGGERSKAEYIPGVFSMVSRRVVGVPNQDFMDLSRLPLPDFRQLPLNRYFAVRKRIYVHVSRGCAFNCIYCSVPECWGKQVREIPIDVFFEQIRALVGEYHPDEIQIVDDNFSHKKGKLVREMCERIKKANLAIRWKCQVRADQLDGDLVRLMAESGCFEIDMGIESGNEKIQHYIRKGLDLQKTAEIIAAIHENGIYAKAFFMLGFPEEDYGQIADTINYAVSLKSKGLNDVAFFPVMPFPGTEVARLTGKVTFQGAIIDDVDVYERSFAAHRLRKYTARPEISLNSRFTPERLRLLVRFAYNQFNLARSVENLDREFEQYALLEESSEYGV